MHLPWRRFASDEDESPGIFVLREGHTNHRFETISTSISKAFGLAIAIFLSIYTSTDSHHLLYSNLVRCR